MKKHLALFIVIATVLSLALTSASAESNYITANYTDNAVTKAGETIPFIKIAETTGTPGENQYVSNFYGSDVPAAPDQAYVSWAKVITEKEATAMDLKIGSKYYRATKVGNFENGCTYTQFFYIFLNYSTITDADVLKQIHVTLLGTPSTGLIKATWPGISSSSDIAYKMLRTVTIGGDVPETGDNTPIALTAGLLLLSGIGLVALKKRTAR